MRIDKMNIECPCCKSEFDWIDSFKGLLNEERKVIVRCKNCGSYLNVKISR